MSSCFGPWATTIDLGPQTRLSTFWRRRLTRLPSVRRSDPFLGWQARSLLGLAGAMLLALPTLLPALVGCRGESASPSRSQNSEPQYDGQPLSYWLAQSKSGSSDARTAAAWRLGVIRPPAISALAQLLRDPEWDVRYSAIGGLRNAGAAGVPVLVEALRDATLQVRNNARSPASLQMDVIQALGSLKAQAAIPALTKLLNDPQWDVRMTAAWSLGLIGPAANTALPALEPLFNDENREVRFAAISALGGIGPAAKAEMPLLATSLRDQDGLVRCAAAAAVWGIDKDSQAKMAMATLVELLEDKEQKVRHSAAQAIGRRGPEAEAAVAALVEMLNAKGTWDRFDAIRALEEIGPQAKVAVPALTALATDKDPHLSQPAREALRKIERK